MENITPNEIKDYSPNSFIFKLNDNEDPIIVIDQTGFTYKGELIEDSGEVYRLFKQFIEGANHAEE
jgi:hypothetical protein